MVVVSIVSYSFEFEQIRLHNSYGAKIRPFYAGANKTVSSALFLKLMLFFATS